jgi:hypothetical protein
MFFKMEECQAWLTYPFNIISDGYGFWTYNNNTITYKKANKIKIDE